MNALIMGLPFCTSDTPVRLYSSHHGHEVRMLQAAGADLPVRKGDYTFEPTETATDAVNRVSREWSPDALICWCPELFPPPLEIEHCPIKTAAIVSDWNVYYAQIECNLARFDIALTDKLGSQSLELRGATPHYLFPLYSQRTSLHRPLGLEKDIDILFAGNLNHAVHVERAHRLEQIASLSGRYNVVICGGQSPEEYTRLLNRARIVFNHSVRREMNLRCFETIACGSLLFLERDNLEIRDWLQDRVEVVLYHQDDLLELLEYCLEHPDKAERIAHQGHAKAKELAGENRLDAFLDWVAAQPMGERAFNDFSEEDRAFADIMLYSSSLVDGQRRPALSALDTLRAHCPNRPESLVASGCATLETMAGLSGAERAQAARGVLGSFTEACELAPEAATLWLDLAYVCRRAGSQDAEVPCLERALGATSCDHGGLLIGSQSDPYYATWRRALATGAERIEILWAGAAARLAMIRLEHQQFDEARDLAASSAGWLPEIAAPHRIRAAAESGLGNHEAAAAILADSLPLSVFDEEHRAGLIREWRVLGKAEEAHALAEESARLFGCCWGSERAAQRFRDLARGE